MKIAIGVLLAATVLLGGCTTPEEAARQRCTGTPDPAACVRADLARQRDLQQRNMDMGGMY